MTRVDVVIVGGGPAGSVLAMLLAREGMKVQLLDRGTFPRGKACGEVLNPAGVAALHELDLGEAVRAEGPAELMGWDMGVPEGTRVTSSFPTSATGEGPRAWGIPRGALDTVLVEAARASGVQVRESAQVVGVESSGKGGRPPRVTLRGPDGGQDSLDARVVVGADGLGSRVSRSLGWARPARSPVKVSFSFRLEGERSDPSRGALFLGGERTLGLAPVSADARRWNATLVLGGDLLEQEKASGRLASAPQELLWESMEIGSFPWRSGPVILEGPWKSGSFHRPTRRVAGGGVLLVGDAAGYFDPLTGQGISRAIRGARIAAPFIIRELGESGSRGDFPGYARSLRGLVAPSQRVQKLLEAVLVRPGLRARGVRALKAVPGAADALIRVTGDLSSPGSLLSPSILAGLVRHGIAPSPGQAATPQEKDPTC